MLDAEGQRLRTELLELFRRPIDSVISDADFDRFAQAVFAYQYQHNAPYAAYCRRRSRTPEDVVHWTSVPAVPTAAFKEVALVAGDPRDAEAVFITSGTTRGAEKRGTHYLLDLSTYHLSLIPNFAGHLLPDNAEMPLLSLIPPVRELANSSLAHMVGVLIDRLGSPGSGYYATARGGVDYAGLEAHLQEADETGVPVCLLGTSFAFVRWLDRLRERGDRFQLPPGSRLMDTGGYKGKTREVPPEELLRGYVELLGLDPRYCINEYGMTELCSQFYDRTLREALVQGVSGVRRKAPPPWVRTRVVDPETLEPVKYGQTGLLQHFDLANLGSVMAIQTEDLGREADGGFLVLGRPAGAAPRGCSIALDELLSAAEEGES